MAKNKTSFNSETGKAAGEKSKRPSYKDLLDKAIKIFVKEHPEYKGQDIRTLIVVKQLEDALIDKSLSSVENILDRDIGKPTQTNEVKTDQVVEFKLVKGEEDIE